MNQDSHLDPPRVHDALGGQPSPDGAQHARDRRLERSSTVMLKVGGALVAVFVILPLAGLAALLLYAQTYQTWPLGGGDMTVEFRLQLLSAALVAIGFVVTCVVALRLSLRRGRIALGLVGLGGLTCLYIGVRGIIEATGVDCLITVQSWGVAVTGVVLLAGASLGIAARARAAHAHPG